MNAGAWRSLNVSASPLGGRVADPNRADGPATEYVSPSGKFVVVDNATKQVLQVSGPGFLPNHP